MNPYRRILSLALALVMLLGCAYAQALDARWTLGNIRITADDQEFIIAPQAEFEILTDGESIALDFGVDMGGRSLLSVAAQLSLDAVNFSLGSRVYSLDVNALIDELGLTDDEKSMIAHLGETIESVSALMGGTSFAYMRENDAIINRMYEILVGKNSEPIEITVDELQLSGRKYAGELKIVHIVDLLNYLRNCDNEDLVLFGNSLLKLINAATNRDYITFTSHYYDGVFGDPNDDTPLAEMEIILGYNDDLVYEKTTQTITVDESTITTISESKYTAEGTAVESNSTESYEDSNSISHMAMEIDGPVTSPTAIRVDFESDEGYTQKNEAANLTLTVREVMGLTFDASVQEGLWNANLTGSQDTAAAYDYGDGPVVVNDVFDMTGSYTETRSDDGRISGKADLAISLDDHSASLQFEIGRGEGAQIEALIGENTQTFILDSDTDSLGYKLLTADAMALAASAAELYADPGIYDLMSYISADGPDWPEDLGDDVYSKYSSTRYEQWRTVYRYADAARIFTGSMPRYSQPANSVLSGIYVGQRNMLIDYLSNDGDFQIDITYLGDGKSTGAAPTPVSVDKFTFVEENGMLMAYYCDDDYLVFFDFEYPDQERAKEVISGLRLPGKKVGLSA